ncbi:hypothetical protein COV24_04255 [candidate division WWE3 bacterium CG10_big_fil_rev_8_21_14_0_10_32_10]|uniref:HTH arsR-type domain-containing protein n=1 Tax=candidate division WWE3 bacterium CG10_big_fil_rev_8_21_14_0_10_32_10 TaxID=1975090 RepID=A0A2H0R9E3_UNCKA|nr:MAG: hypothetical protein COV24_04255 [candidate division WWE3 bacterium CG10_big_fil_rev_8_21_14_0_10_32_10]
MKSNCMECVKVLGDNTRLAIYNILSKNYPKEYCVGDVVGMVEVKQPTVSYHLGRLFKYGLVSSKRDGKKILYSANEKCPHYNKVCIFKD